MTKVFAGPLLAAAIVGLASVPASAEPFAITSGRLVFDFEGDSFGFRGDGFSVGTFATPFEFLGGGPDPVSRPIVLSTCRLCAPGDVVDPGFRTIGEIFLGTGSATFGSTTHSNVTFHGWLDFDAVPVTFPSTSEPFFFVATPFLFSGFVRAFTGGIEVAAVPLSGRGVAGLPFFETGGGTYEWEEGALGFTFDQPPAPVPEPSTLLLMLTGAGAIVTRCRARRAKKREAAAFG